MPGVIDVALVLALLAAFVSVAFVKAAEHRTRADGRMSLALDALTIIAVSAGAFFFLAGTVGLLRFPDALSRLHALTKADNLGLGLVVLGLLFQADRAARRAEACRRLAARSAGRSHRHPTDCAHRPTGRAAGVTIALAFDVGLAVLVLGLAAWTIAARDTFAAVVGFVAFGLLLALVWVRLAAPDVALTEAAIGGGVTGGLLVGAAPDLRPSEALAAARRRAQSCALRPRCCAHWSRRGSRRSCCCCPSQRRRSRRRPPRKLAATGLGNPVTAVLMAYRAIDTLLETVVLLLALVGVWSLAPDRVLGRLPGTASSRRPGRRADLSRTAAAADWDTRRASISFGSGSTLPGANSRAPRSLPRCGSWR